MSANNHYDVIIIGTGAGGGTLAYKLAPSGKRILVLERSGYLPREKDNWSTRAVFIEGKYKQEVWYDRKGKEFHPGQHYYVGGNTKMYGAILFRLRREDFGEIRHFGGISPAWPISYDDLEPYYTQAEQLYQVHGERGSDPTEPEAGAPFPYPAVSHEPRIQKLNDDWHSIGVKAFPLPVGIMLNEALRHQSPCIRCDTCDGFPCLVHAKSDSEVVAVRPALQHANVTLLTQAKVTKLETDASGRPVNGVVVERDGAPETYSGDVVVVSCGAVNSAVLLLQSASDKHPNGLANRSGVVGRHYMAHLNTAFLALSRIPNPTVFQKTLGINIQTGHRFYNGHTLDELVENYGTNKLGIESGPQIIIRGLLVDVAGWKGVQRLEPGYVITVADVEVVLAQQEITISRGDALLFHTGWGNLWMQDNETYLSGEPGPVVDYNLIAHFDGYPDPTESKADAHVIGIKPALAYDNVTLQTNSTVDRLETDSRRRKIERVTVKKDDGSEEVYTADWVIVAAGAINSATLFLRSKSDTLFLIKRRPFLFEINITHSNRGHFYSKSELFSHRNGLNSTFPDK